MHFSTNRRYDPIMYADLAMVFQLALQLWSTGSSTLLKGLEAAAMPLDKVIAVQHFTQVCQAHVCTLQVHRSCPSQEPMPPLRVGP
jgi:hypothetical protein